MNRLWLDLVIGKHGEFQGTTRWLLNYAADSCISLASTEDEDDVEISRAAAVAKEIAHRVTDQSQAPGGEPHYFVMVTDEELEDVKAVLEYMAEYWSACNYAETEGPDEDILAGRVADAYGPGMSMVWGDIFGGLHQVKH